MPSYIAIHEGDYKTNFPLFVIEKVLLSLNFIKTIQGAHLIDVTAFHKEENGYFRHEKCGTVIAFANENGSYGHYGLPQKVNLIELIVWDDTFYNDCKVLASKIAERLNWQVYRDE